MIRLNGLAKYVASIGLVVSVAVLSVAVLNSPGASMPLTLTGETVTVSYETEPVFGHGHFHLINPADTPITVSIERVWLGIGEHRYDVDPTTVWDRQRSRDLEPASFQVEAQSALEFYVSFPQESRPVASGETVSVGLKLAANGEQLEAVSVLDLVRRLRRTD